MASLIFYSITPVDDIENVYSMKTLKSLLAVLRMYVRQRDEIKLYTISRIASSVLSREEILSFTV